MKFGTWNVRSLLGKMPHELVSSAACRERLSMIAVQECRWEEIEKGKEMGDICGMGEVHGGMKLEPEWVHFWWEFIKLLEER